MVVTIERVSIASRQADEIAKKISPAQSQPSTDKNVKTANLPSTNNVSTDSIAAILRQMQSDLEEGRALSQEISSLNSLVQNLDCASVPEDRSFVIDKPEKINLSKDSKQQALPEMSTCEPKNVGAGDAASKMIEFATKYRNFNSKPPSQESRSRAPNNSPNRAKSLTEFLSQGRLSFAGAKQKVKISMKQPPTSFRRNQPLKFVQASKNLSPSTENHKHSGMRNMTGVKYEKSKFAIPPPAVRDMLTLTRNKFKQPKQKIAVPLSIINLELI